MNIFESFWDKGIFAGYSLSMFRWINALFVLLGCIVVFGAAYFFVVWFFGFMKMDQTQKDLCLSLRNDKETPKQERKEKIKNAPRPVKNVLFWQKNKPWIIPVASFVVLVSMLGAAILPVVWDQLIMTLSGSKVTVYDTEASKQAAAEAKENVVTIEEEAIVLLKNDNNCLPLNMEESNKVNMFGSCTFGMLYGNGGSGTFATNWKDSKSGVSRYATRFNEAMSDEGFEYNQHLYNLVANKYAKVSGYSIADQSKLINTGINTYNYAEIVSTCIPYDYEIPASVYTRTDISGMNGKSLLDEAKEYSDVAIYTISRYGTESQDMNTSEMQLKTEEVNMINMLKENFEKVIIILNVPESIECRILEDEGIDAVLFVGHPGLTGTKAIAEVLSGAVNPSGRLVDTWAYDAKSAPSYQSFGNDTVNTFTNGGKEPFVEFVEGIYVGYRYYVTRAMVDDDYSYEDNVQYSFGYGLSYTKFEQHITQYKVDSKKETIEVSVAVTNKGDVAGKDVIQLYTHVPYIDGGVEKAWYSLIDFGKTSIIEPGETKNYKFDFTFRDQASWSSEDGCYILDAGEYEISLRKNVWDIWDSTEGKGAKFTFNLSNKIEYRESYQTGYEYENIFEDVEYGPSEDPIQYLSRSDFAGTWTNKADINRRSVSSKIEGAKALGNWKFDDDQIEGDTPTTGAKNDITLRDMKDADWDDERWEDLLDNLTVSEMQNLIDNGGFQTAEVKSISKAASKDYDGPASAFHSGTGHPSEVSLASTWNTNMAEIMGNSIGKEGAARGITGWYAPGINIHRSPYGGRNFEYYSEDPLISGQMAGYTSIGLSKYGVYAYAKHFALNEQEKNRENLFCWASEQAIREIYARGFEHYVNLGGIGIMTAFNKVGSYWAGASEALCTTLLREEWGFHGVVVTDYCYQSTMGANVGLRAQNDLWLLKNSTYGASYAYNQTPHDGLKLLRRASKNILYACAHSNNVWTLEDYQAVGIDEIIKATDRS